jgi:hypothetical protein
LSERTRPEWISRSFRVEREGRRARIWCFSALVVEGEGSGRMRSGSLVVKRIVNEGAEGAWVGRDMLGVL